MKKLITLVCLSLLCGCSGTDKKAEAEATEAPQPVYACRYIDSYDYNQTVPWKEAPDDSYYDDVLFAGDSRMGSIYLYGTHKNAEVAYVTSLNLMRIKSMNVDERTPEITLWDVLDQTDKQNIYLLFGINEIRNPNFDAFGDTLREVVDMLQKNNPEVQIYLVLSYHPDLITGLPEPGLTEHLDMLNGKLIEIAKEKRVFWVNPDEALDDDQGTVIDDYVWDGLHFNPTGAKAFEQFLAEHVVRRDDYVKKICE
ncbi:MAG: SGNH/GDSL hydrolase family protein [Solobacterium sp.]|nr:SGNH/GDSL hydrolase family protein [Solobacterium sp.]